MKTLAAIALLAALAIVATGACASDEAGAPASDAAVAAVPTRSAIDFQIGNNIGDRIPDFDITLTDGTPVTASLLLERERPAFLFFFGNHLNGLPLRVAEPQEGLSRIRRRRGLLRHQRRSVRRPG